MSSQHEHDNLQQLIADFLAGDTKVYLVVKARISQYVCHQRFRGNIDSEDLVADTLAVLLDYFRKGGFKGDSISALNVFIYNTIRNQISKKARGRYGRAAAIDSSQDGIASSRSLADESVDRLLAERILASLDPACRQLLWLRFHEHWTDQEIADHLRKTKNAVSTAICRCLRKSRELGIVKEVQ